MPDPTHPKPPLTAQTDALRALLRIAELHPSLPGAYVVAHNLMPDRVDVQLDTPSAWESWREILNAPTGSATHRTFDNRRHLECVTAVGKTAIRVYAVFPHIHDTDAGAV
ncbi:hypothetical protein [Streptomyces sp. NBC_00448]|uniref:hypothetical protein n=1 Tax=Streptomyces sp. NBC_00448 TaxID=2903652 RepID=UPI002E1A6BF6